MGGIAPLRDREPAACRRTSRSAGWTRSTTACSSGPPRPASAIVGGNVARSRQGIVVDVTLLGDAGAPAAALAARGRATTSWSRARSAPRRRACACWRRARGSTTTASWSRPGSGPSRRRRRCSRCLRAQLDPRPPLALARSLAERGLARAGHGPLRRPLERPLRDLRGERRRRRVIDARAAAGRPQGRRPRARARAATPLALALHGGEDYQLLLAVAPDGLEEAARARARLGRRRSRRRASFVEGEPAVRLREAAGSGRSRRAGHDHFRAARRRS